MRGLAQRVRFVIQREQEGYGHAVYQTSDFAGNQPVLLCLGDHLFRGDPVSPYQEMARMAAVSGGRSVSAVNRIGPDELKGFGTIAGKRHADNPRLIDVRLIIEKPDVRTARRNLRVDGLGNDEFLGWFGMHLLAPSIYDILGKMIRDNIRDNGEFQLTRAQELQRQQEGYLALEMVSAKRFDFGMPDDFVRSLGAFRGL
jgi:UTP--glucose-1-phosphate uridylyltransferase